MLTLLFCSRVGQEGEGVVGVEARAEERVSGEGSGANEISNGQMNILRCLFLVNVFIQALKLI